MANKRKSDQEVLGKKIIVRCTDFEYQRWKKMKEDHGVSMSEMMRASMDGNKLQTKSDAKVIAELRREAGSLNSVLKENPSIDALLQSDIRQTLSLMIATMNKVMGV